MSNPATQPQAPSQQRPQQSVQPPRPQQFQQQQLPQQSKQPPVNVKRPPPPRPLHPVIEIVNGYKHFGISKKWHQVMRNVNLMAYGGQVYVLLGPHGSGKTTILNVILGVCYLNHGSVKVFGVEPGNKEYGCPGPRVGYTPQSNGLFRQMTINETFKYYGKMLRLKSDYISERISHLSDLLALPSGKSFISQCTDEEKRQISFAISILHEPELLLLDEPCQGVGPVLRTNIWDQLKVLVKKGVTVFLTTQNLPEASKADRLGVLRNGYLLLEGSPNELIDDYHESDIETLYTSIYSLKIKKADLSEKRSIHEHPRVRLERISTTESEGFIYVEDPDDVMLKNEKGEKKKHRLKCTHLKRFLKILPNCKRLGMVLFRDLVVTFRSYVWLIAVFLVPIILVILFILTVGGHPTNLNVGIVNLEASVDQCKVVPDDYISCQVINLIDGDVIQKIYYDKYREAQDDAFDLKLSAILIVGEKFTEQLLRTMAALATKAHKMDYPDTAQLILRLDMTSRIVANTIEHEVKRAVEKYLKTATNDTKIQNATIGYPMHVGKPLFGTEDSADTEFICLGLTVVFLYHLASFLAAITMVTYKVWNLAVRDYVAGVRVIESILSQMIIYGILLFIEAVLMYATLALIRNLPIVSALPYLILVIFLQIWCGLCFGFFIASLTKTGVQAGCVVFCCLCASLILCGVLWPLNGQPSWLLAIVKLLPQTQAICAVRCIVQRGISISNEEVYLGVIIPLVWLLLFVLLTYLLTK